MARVEGHRATSDGPKREQQIFDAMMGLGLDDAPVRTLPDDARARTVIAAATRARMREILEELKARGAGARGWPTTGTATRGPG